MARTRVTEEQTAQAEAAIVDRSKRIDFYTTEYNVELLVTKLTNEEFVVPDYQRAYTWDEPRKAKFIESVLIGLPIPFLFFWEGSDGKMEIVDGSQRLRTLKEYVDGGLVLKDLEEIPSLNKTKFSDLLPGRQRKFLNKSIRGIVLNENADPQARFDMFERINTGSKVANPAEVRRGALAGPFQSLVEELAQGEKFSRLAPVSKKSKDERVPDELVTRFFAYGDGLEDYKDSPNRFVFEYTKKMNKICGEHPEVIEQYRSRFDRMLSFVAKNFNTGFTKPSNPKTTPRVRFEAIAIGVDQAISEAPDIVDKDFSRVSDWLESADFKTATTSDAANVKSKLERRIAFVKDALLGEI
ncbi:DUF262 domain-containing protein [Thalassospira sp. A3_1]|uniref:DUF262 domain-containing protein n=1 Tax=Thalassospira sp. A3_1 TaxID=2821088 RepID=UPI001ADCB74B|nr:DUF262 domain-containing protein [Thalassospira sp. A3_1]MBO9506486.1 DUF262 domain-containing protein [Thalassospira sp. A3_1]